MENNYDENEDIQEMRNTNFINEKNNYKSDIQDFLERETSEPEINYFLNTEPESKEGAEVLRKCVNYFFERKWEALINYLEIGGIIIISEKFYLLIFF